jgi:hypothetical protein
MDCPVIAVGLFGIAALGGVANAACHLRKGNAPAPLALGHGAIAAAGLVTLIGAVGDGSATSFARYALVVLSIAALGGVAFLVGFRLPKRPIPPALIIGHGLIAAVGFVLLCIGVFGGPGRGHAIGKTEPQGRPIPQAEPVGAPR